MPSEVKQAMFSVGGDYRIKTTAPVGVNNSRRSVFESARYKTSDYGLVNEICGCPELA